MPSIYSKAIRRWIELSPGTYKLVSLHNHWLPGAIIYQAKDGTFRKLGKQSPPYATPYGVIVSYSKQLELDRRYKRAELGDIIQTKSGAGFYTSAG